MASITERIEEKLPTPFQGTAANIKFPETHYKPDPKHSMHAVQWRGKKKVKLAMVPRPLITEPKDAVIKVTATTICGSDLHLYNNEFQGLAKGDILGHECVGIVQSVGDQVENIQIGDRVVVSCVIAEGSCYYCKNGLFSCCDETNPSREMERQYGHRTAGIFGYSQLLGGYEGSQADYVRVPFADVNCLKIPPSVDDERALLLSDVACTAWHANVLGDVHEGQNVAIWGCGPIGLMTIIWAKFRGAKRVIAIDCYDYRLDFAKKLGAEVINFEGVKVTDVLKEMVPGGLDVCIDAAGFRFPKSLIHKMQRTLKLETDSPEVLKEAILACRKGGIVSIVGDYYSMTNGFPIGAMMEKGLTLRGSQVHVQSYWKELLGYIEKGKVDPSILITHRMPLSRAAEAYEMFDERMDGVIKILLKPQAQAEERR